MPEKPTYRELAKRVAELENENSELRRIKADLSRLNAVLDETPDIIATADLDGRVRYANRAAYRVRGVDHNADPTEHTISSAHPDWANDLVQREGIPAALQTGSWRGETALLAHDGREIPVSQIILAHKTPEGVVEYLSTIARDISEQKSFAMERRRRLGYMKKLIKAVRRILAQNTPEGILQRAAGAAREITAARLGASFHRGKLKIRTSHKAGEAAASRLEKRLASEMAAMFSGLIEKAASIRLTADELLGHPVWKKLSEGHPLLRGLLAVPLADRDGTATGMIMVSDKEEGDFAPEDEARLMQLSAFASLAMQNLEARQAAESKTDELEVRVQERTAELTIAIEALESEIQEHRLTGEKLLESERRYRELAERSLQALENDRKLVAKELHDSIGASLAAIKFSLEEKLEKMGKTSIPDGVISLEKIISYFLDTIKETRRISARLRPTTLDDLGLLATIRSFCREFTDLYSHIRLDASLDIREDEIPETLKIVLYRILQEAMTNAAKHSGAKEVDVLLKKIDRRIALRVADNGSGFELNERMVGSDPFSGFGLAGMKERAEICGGSFSILSRKGSGTTVEVFLPFEQ
jgi:PAS domain S-box-containing protein